MPLHIYKNTGELIDGLAKWIIAFVNRALQTQERFTIALSGGETPKALYSLLASDYRDAVDWNKLHVFWGDERFVPFTDDNNNAKMAYERLLNRVNIPASNIHRMRTDIGPHLSAEEYEKVLHRYFNDATHTFDLVLAGMGKDGHTLSLFPGSTALHHENWVEAVYLEAQQMYRITVLPPVVNKAASVAFVVTGAEKAETLRSVLKGIYRPDEFPSQLIQPANGDLHWFLDEEAAAKL